MLQFRYVVYSKLVHKKTQEKNWGNKKKASRGGRSVVGLGGSGFTEPLYLLKKGFKYVFFFLCCVKNSFFLRIGRPLHLLQYVRLFICECLELVLRTRNLEVPLEKFEMGAVCVCLESCRIVQET